MDRRGQNERTVDLKFISYYCHELSTKNTVALPLPLPLIVPRSFEQFS